MRSFRRSTDFIEVSVTTSQLRHSTIAHFHGQRILAFSAQHRKYVQKLSAARPLSQNFVMGTQPQDFSDKVVYPSQTQTKSKLQKLYSARPVRQTFVTGAQSFGQTNDVNETSLQTNCSGFENLETLAKTERKKKRFIIWATLSGKRQMFCWRS